MSSFSMSVVMNTSPYGGGLPGGNHACLYGALNLSGE
jgi:hypothetical protein